MAKRKRSVKQRANDKRLGAMAKARGRKSSTRKTKTRRRVSVKRVIRSTRRRVSMVKRRSTSRKSGLISPKIKSIGTKIAIGAGVGAGLGLLGSVVGQPNIGRNPLLAAGGAFVLGGPIAGVIALITGGGLGALGLGGASNGQSGGGI